MWLDVRLHPGRKTTDSIDATVGAAVGARLENTGQACNAAKTFIVTDDLYDVYNSVLEKLYAAQIARDRTQRRSCGPDGHTREPEFDVLSR